MKVLEPTVFTYQVLSINCGTAKFDGFAPLRTICYVSKIGCHHVLGMNRNWSHKIGVLLSGILQGFYSWL